MCRKLGYEIVDQNNLFIPTLEKYANQSLSKSNKILYQFLWEK